MFIITEKKIKETVHQILADELPKILLSLDPDKHYILVVPPDIPVDTLQEAFEPFRGKQNLVVMQAKSVKLLEVS